MKKSDARWVAFVAIFGLLFALETFFLLKPQLILDSFIGPDPKETRTQPAAKIEKIGNELKKQVSGSLLWREASLEDFLFENDRIMTGDRGSAEISLTDSGGIVMGPNTLVQIESLSRGSSDPIRIRIDRGIFRRLSGITPRPITLTLGGAKIATSADAEFSAKIVESADGKTTTEIELTQGTANVRSQGGQEAKLISGQRTTVDGDQITPPQTMAFVPITPQSFAVVSSPSNERAVVTFEWRGLPLGALPGQPVRLEVADPEKSYARVSEKVIPGTIAKRGSTRATLDILLSHANRRPLVWRVFSVHQEKATEWVPFVLEPPIAKRKTFPILQLDRSSDPIPPPPPPELNEPEINKGPTEKQKRPRSFIRYMQEVFAQLWFSSVYAAENDLIVVTLSWKAVPGVETYRVQISKEKEFSQPLAEEVIAGTEWAWTPPPGISRQTRMYYRVASLSNGGASGSYSKSKKIQFPDEPEVYDAQDKVALKGDEQGEIHVQRPVAVVSESETSASPQRKPKIIAKNFISTFWIGLGNTVQVGKTGSALEQVSGSSLFFREGVGFDLQLGRKGDPKHAFFLSGRLEVATFTSDDDSVLFEFPSLHSARSSLSLLTEFGKPPRLVERNHLFFGGLVDVSHRFEKSGPQSLHLKYGFSLGPELKWQHHPAISHWSAPRAIELFLQAPIFGAIWGSHLTLKVGTKVAWMFYKKNHWSIGCDLMANAATTVWASAKQNQFEWSALLAPTIAWSL